jgi:hypothetical protein
MIPQGASLYIYSFNGKAFINPKEASIEIDDILKKKIRETFSKFDLDGKPVNRWNVPVRDFDLDKINVCNTGRSTHSQSTLSLPIFDRDEAP